MSYWLVKSEPNTYSIDDLKRDKSTLWDGIRNYQARNYLQSMKVGDEVLFYHSNSEPSAIVGLCTVTKTAVPDPTQFDKKSKYYDDGASSEKPRWFSPTFKFSEAFEQPIELPALRKVAKLKNMVLLQRGSRLSVHPVTVDEFNSILALRS